ncbi:MAG TPA: hypothetical protein VIC56_06595 [Gemmatimonadota bacterium]|jgi:hypothetical protein
MTVPAEARDRELFVRCRTCGFPVATGIRAGRDVPAAADPDLREHRCPRCGAEHAYGGDDYSIRE